MYYDLLFNVGLLQAIHANFYAILPTLTIAIERGGKRVVKLGNVLLTTAEHHPSLRRWTEVPRLASNK